MTDGTEPTNIDWVISQVRDRLKPPQRGTVKQVYEHTSSDDVSNHEVDVQLVDEPDRTRRRLPVAVPTDDAALVPRGPDDPDGPDDVLVQFVDGNSERGIVTHVVPTAESRAPQGQAGDVRVTRGDLYAELSGDGSVARLAEKPGDLDGPTAEIAIDASGAETVARVDADTVVLGAGGSQVITDATLETTTDSDGHVTSVSLSLTRSETVETE